VVHLEPADRRVRAVHGGPDVGMRPGDVREALSVPGCVRDVFALPDIARAHPDIRAAVDSADPAVRWLEVDHGGLTSLAETVHPQGLVAVCGFLDVDYDHLLTAGPRLLAVCADVRDPGNAGTVIRCADAAGADGVVLAGRSVDPYNGKAVRASAGSLFHLPVSLTDEPAEAVHRAREAGLLVLAADGGGDVDLDEAADSGLLSARTAWLFGNEAWGLPDELARTADHRVRIPIHGRAESLNLATAAAVCLYASARAHRGSPPGAPVVSPRR
jgi:TrmH family RNA methyltransferase